MHLSRPEDEEVLLPRTVFQIRRLVFLRNLLSELLKEFLSGPLMIVAMPAIGLVGLVDFSSVRL